MEDGGRGFSRSEQRLRLLLFLVLLCLVPRSFLMLRGRSFRVQDVFFLSLFFFLLLPQRAQGLGTGRMLAVQTARASTRRQSHARGRDGSASAETAPSGSYGGRAGSATCTPTHKRRLCSHHACMGPAFPLRQWFSSVVRCALKRFAQSLP